MAHDNQTDLKALQNSIQDQIARQFPAFRLVEFYRDEESEALPTPACLLELDEFEHVEEDPGTDQLMVSLRFSARLVFSRERGPKALMNVRLAAASLASFINKNRFCGNIFPARIHNAGPDFFRPDLTSRYAIWRLEWSHAQAILGQNIWQEEDETGPAVTSIIVNGKEIHD